MSVYDESQGCYMLLMAPIAIIIFGFCFRIGWHIADLVLEL
jgi:hypothetical protein